MCKSRESKLVISYHPKCLHKIRKNALCQCARFIYLSKNPGASGQNRCGPHWCLQRWGPPGASRLLDRWVFFERPKMERIGGRNAGLNGCMCHWTICLVANLQRGWNLLHPKSVICCKCTFISGCWFELCYIFKHIGDKKDPNWPITSVCSEASPWFVLHLVERGQG